MKIDPALLQSAVKKYTKTFEHHKANPLSAETLHAWDAADAELSAVINNDETNIIIALLERAEAAEVKLLVPVKLPADEIGEAASFMSAAEVIPVSIVIARIKAAGYQVEGGE